MRSDLIDDVEKDNRRRNHNNNKKEMFGSLLCDCAMAFLLMLIQFVPQNCAMALWTCLTTGHYMTNVRICMTRTLTNLFHQCKMFRLSFAFRYTRQVSRAVCRSWRVCLSVEIKREEKKTERKKIFIQFSAPPFFFFFSLISQVCAVGQSK